MRPTDVLVTGFVKSPVVMEQSLAPIRALRFDGVIRHIHYVTWDSPELDPWLAPLSRMSDIKLTRVPQSDATGNAAQRGVAYQVANLETGLKLLSDDDALVLKYRPDFIASARLLRDKIMNFDRLCAPVSQTAPNGVEMPAPVLAHKIWVPWADANNPFGYEDAAFLGTVRDIKTLVTKLDASDHAILGADNCGTYAHVVRFGKIFRERWPLFENYLRHYDYFPNDFDYRTKLVPAMVDDAFFWHLVIAHAWILLQPVPCRLRSGGRRALLSQLSESGHRLVAARDDQALQSLRLCRCVARQCPPGPRAALRQPHLWPGAGRIPGRPHCSPNRSPIFRPARWRA